jgi:hypothetical protein
MYSLTFRLDTKKLQIAQLYVKHESVLAALTFMLPIQARIINAYCIHISTAQKSLFFILHLVYISINLVVWLLIHYLTPPHHVIFTPLAIKYISHYICIPQRKDCN